jgi:hypothetical protein
MNRGLKIAFDVNTFLTFMAFILLVIKPALLPAAVGVHVDPTGYFEGYMLGAAEWGLATMTLLGRRLTDISAIRVISIACIVFHMSSAVVMIITFITHKNDFGVGLWTNVLVPRVGISLMCAYFGLYKTAPAVAV